MYRDVQARSGRGSRIALLTGTIAVATFLLVGSFSAYQVSERSRATLLIERGIASVTDVDTYLSETLPGVREQALADDADLVALPGYPIDIRLSADELATAPDDSIRQLVLRRSAAQVYERGLQAFASEGGQSLGFLTIENTADAMLSLVREPAHSRSGVATVVLLLIVAVSAVVVAASDFRPGVLRTIGGAMFGASLTGLALSAGVMFLVGRTGGDDPFNGEVADIIQSAFDVGRRNFLVASAFSGLLFGAGAVLAFLERRDRRAEAGTPGWDEFESPPAFDDYAAVPIGQPDEYPGEELASPRR